MVASSLHIRVGNRPIPPIDYTLDPMQGYVSFLRVHADSAFSFVASYQYVPLELQSEYHLWERVSPEIGQTGTQQPPVPSNFGNLRSNGSISRGVMTGTGRDASVESGLRLEVEGEITDSISVRAVLTDEDTPLLPEGTTSRLEQFDQVFIEFASPKGKIALGDLDISLREGQFSRVKRRVQGVNFATNALSLSSLLIPKGSIQATGATSKGKFKSQFISILEGIQGPYRLEGDASERFILILPGTERVYVDGRLLERGITSDYIIDYTTAEITFMPSRMVAPNNRIRVEFEYTTNQFSRSFLASEASVLVGSQKGKPVLFFGVTAIREADGDSFAEELGFSSQDSLVISASGDRLIYASGATEVVFDPEALYTQYFLTSGNDGYGAFTAVDHPPGPSEKVYRVTFTRVGPGNGSYKRQGSFQDLSLANGIVYTYVGRDLGEYDAVRPLTPPGSKEMVDLRLQSAASPLGSLSAEWAASRNDRNTLSSIDSADDIGSATALRFISTPLVIGRYSLSGKADYSRRSPNFSSFDRTRSIEFERDWNLTALDTDPLQNIRLGQSEGEYGAELFIHRADSSQINFGFDFLSLGKSFEASRARFSLVKAENRWPKFTMKGRQVSSTDNELQARNDWYSLLSSVSKTLVGSLIQPYMEWETERYSGSGYAPSDRGLRLDFDEIRLGGQLGSENSRLWMFFEQRFESDDAKLAPTNSIQTLQTKWAFQRDSALRTGFSVGIRRIATDSGPTASNAPAQNSLLLGVDGEWNAGVQNRLSWLYQVQSEQTSRLQEIYIRTGQERGEYVWEDFNSDGVIQIEEFIPETTPNEGEYALTYFPSDSLEFVTSLTASTRYNRTGGGTGNRLGRIGLSTVVEVSEKTRDPERSHVYLLQLGSFRSSDYTVNGRLRVGQEFRFLPSNTRYDLDVSGSEIWAFTDLASGEQRTRTSEWNALLGFRPSVVWGLASRITRRIDNSEAGFASRSFNIEGFEWNPSVSYRPIQEWLFTLGAQLANRTDRNQGTKAQAVQIPLSIQYQSGTKWTARARVEMASIKLDGASVGLQTFHLTEGRGAGSSWLWGLSLNARLTDVLTASFGYDGRAPNRGNTIHTGRIQFTARF